MLNIEVNLPIGNEAENRWMAMWGGENVVFSLDTIKRIFEENPDEKDVTLNFNCDGGYVSEGFAIYDYLRTSGRNIHCNIESGCHSMAIVMLLSAPLDNRTAQKHATSLIHCVRAEMWGNLTAEELEAMAEELKADEEKILDIYADRTGEDKENLRQLMHEEKMRDTDFLLEHHFISKVNAYNTNRRNTQTINSQNSSNNMAKGIKEVLAMAENCVGAIKNLLVSEPSNYDHTDADGNVLFTTEVDDDTLEVGMTASPDGTFELPDGRTIVIADGAITEIREASAEGDGDNKDNEEVQNLRNEVENLKTANADLTNTNEALRADNEALTNRINALEGQLNEASDCINELKATISSNYKPNGSTRTAQANKPEDSFNKDDVRERMGLKKQNND